MPMPDYWLENVKVTGHAASRRQRPELVAHARRREKMFRTSRSPIRTASDFAEAISREDLIITFIYTRCPFPDFCPRMSSNFAEIYKQLDSNPSLADAQLLSVSFDPEHDTPKVLRDYGFSGGAHARRGAVPPLAICRAQSGRFAEDRRLLRV